MPCVAEEVTGKSTRKAVARRLLAKSMKGGRNRKERKSHAKARSRKEESGGRRTRIELIALCDMLPTSLLASLPPKRLCVENSL